MTENIEIEFKNMLTAEEFRRLLNFFNVTASDFKKQTNHYFDTRSFSLKENGSALRIREKENGFEMTLKQPAPRGLLETNQSISADAAKDMIHSGKPIEGAVKEAVSRLIGNLDSLQYFGSLTTIRAEFEYKVGLLVLDHSYYLNLEDYEIEYEVADEEEGSKIFSALLEGLNIPIRPTDNKIRRFYLAKYHQLKE